MDNNIEGISHSVQGAYSWPKLEIYPNPFKDYLDIGILNTIFKGLIFEVYDLQWRVVAKLGVESERGYTRYYRWDATSTIPGLYF